MHIKSFRIIPMKFKFQARRLGDKCFGKRAGVSKKEIKENKDKYWCSPFLSILAIEKGKVIGKLKLYRKDIAYCGKKIILGAIGGVCVTKKKRNKGIASSLLKEGIKEFKKRKFEVGYLCTDIKNHARIRLYSKFGFVILNKPYTYLSKSGKRYTEKNGMIAPITSKSKFNLILKGKKIFDIGLSNV
jgi:ribosomal protein S18 acetylase RimI-like enzyme